MVFCLPDISGGPRQADADVIRSGWWGGRARTMEFQKKFAEYVGAKHCIAVNSCTAALHLALLTQEIGPRRRGDYHAADVCLTGEHDSRTSARRRCLRISTRIRGSSTPLKSKRKVTNRTRARWCRCIIPASRRIWA